MRQELQRLRKNAANHHSPRRLLKLLDRHQGPWPVRDLILCYQAVWKSLPEAAKMTGNTTQRHHLQQLDARVKEAIPSLVNVLAGEDHTGPAIIDSTSKIEIPHSAIPQFLYTFDLGLGPSRHGKPRVAVVLPNGALMAMACLAVCNSYTAGPGRCGSPLETELENLQTIAPLVPVYTIHPHGDFTFHATCLDSNRITSHGVAAPNTADDVSVILFTSGTSGKKKLVPITTYNLIASAVLSGESLGLAAKDRCLNMMPLHHIGGMVRSLLGPIVAGGAIICCPAFDPSMFWDVVSQLTPTWYYATPTMHQMILAEAQHRGDAVRRSTIQFICNAGAGLPPTLAVELHKTFNCLVFPSYGMTECAPIAAPPLDYCLDRPGTSGVCAGPELVILENPDADHAASSGTTGHICVRGSPLFQGYLASHGLDQSVFSALGWFDTGDLGHMDDEGYLYITGRSKEVINRGGEIISPVEVEDAILAAARDPTSLLHGRITEALVFSASHDVLQEVVGAVLVTAPGRKRPDIRQVHEALQERLPQPKWPMILVYMSAVPKSNNKMQRIGLSKRLQLDRLTDSTVASDRHYEAECPPPNTPLTQRIEKKRCIEATTKRHVSLAQEHWMPDILMRRNKVDGFLQAILFFRDHRTITAEDLISHLREEQDGYLVPSSVKFLGGSLPLDEAGSVDEALVDDALREQDSPGACSEVQQRVRDLFATALGRPPEDVYPSTDFFTAGGDSLRAGRFVPQPRRKLDIHLPGDILFRHSTLGTLSGIVEDAVAMQADRTLEHAEDLPGCSETHCSTHPVLLLLHLLPLAVFYPMKTSLQWVLFVHDMAETSLLFPLRGLLAGRLLYIVIGALAARLIVQTTVPLVGIIFKWIVIGRYQPGVYPMWGVYHTRWWLTQKALQVCGKGIYNWYNWTRKLYFQALGVKMGRNVIIHESASLGEYDLIELGNNVILDHCTCRPFAVERMTSMLLKPIHLRDDCAVGLKSIVAPGADLAAGTCLGPNSSSWESNDAVRFNLNLQSAMIPEPHWILGFLVTEPMCLAVSIARRLPWLAGLVPIVSRYPSRRHDMVHQTVDWFTTPKRIGYHILARIYLAIFGPLVMFIAILTIKRGLDCVCRRPKPGPAQKQSQLQKLRSSTLGRILPRGDLHALTRLLGRHYELVSIVVRALGARVGKRVYWPSVFPSVQDFDLLEIGNDVVFGSRSHLVTSDGLGKDRVVIEDGAMVGDRAVLLPGVTVGARTMIGSGALMRRNGSYAADTVWTGSKRGDAIQFPTPGVVVQGDNGDAKLLDTTIKPFGRAFCLGKANYHVLGLIDIVCYSTCLVILVTVYWHLSTLCGLLVLRHVLSIGLTAFQLSWWRPFTIYITFTASVCVCSLLQSVFALMVAVLAKWALMGRRQEGEYHWDKSSYNQRWQLFLAFETLIKDCYGGLGILQLLSGTWYVVLYYRAMGARIGRNCALFANGSPSIYFTEPDLLTLGDRVAVDDASLVCHLNSRGEFELHTLEVGDRSVLRTGSRLMSGASMGQDACLLEHTLVLSGDHVGDGISLQGWPAEVFNGSRV
ncbi:hypothetical protein FE257_009105 [Aspergillus nanangensis]|uniref:Carrier domain-containing protein n=1 Tax=Aspergillus nanangensis TaxID=2582783 RepID=A0AAD4GYL9_ASPNN|nr:hypothetical protein FE257_009105 [Aspergillus nanangensis]